MTDKKQNTKVNLHAVNPNTTNSGGQSQGTHRKLEARHLQMIAIGGTIGTGLFLNSSNVIRDAGALGALIAYIIAGIAVFFVVASLGEMATLMPVTGSFSAYASRFIDPALGFTSGWNYWMLWVIALPIELLACGEFLDYWIAPVWQSPVSKYLSMAVVLAIVVFINCLAVKGFGEMEYWLALIKILAILFFIVVSIYVLIRDQPGLSNYEAAGGPFLDRSTGQVFTAIIEAMVGAVLAFGGTEMVGITAGEAKNPRRSVPRAINGTFWRIMIFYVSTILLIGLLLPANSPEFDNSDKLAGSPFVLALKKGQIPGVDHFMNFICFSAVFSAANSSVYASARALYGLALAGRAPSFLLKLTHGVPINGIILTVCISSVAFLGKLVGDGVVWTWLTSLVSLCIIIAWLMINVTHLRFRKAYVAQGYKIEDLPYKALFFPYGCYFGIFVCCCIVILNPLFTALSASKNGESAALAFTQNFLNIPVCIALFLFWKYKKGTKLVPLTECDIATGNINLNPEIEEVDLQPKKKSGLSKILNSVA